MSMNVTKKSDWADKLVAKQYGHEDDDCIAGLLRAEYKRAVRIVNKIYDAGHIRREGFNEACEAILTALQKGR